MRLLLAMAWRNLGRNRRRTAINLCAIAFATMTMIFMTGMQAGSYDQMIDSSVRMQTGHLQVQAAGYLENEDINLTVDAPERVYAALDAQPGVVGAVARITTGMLVAKGDSSFVAVVIGTDAARERQVSTWPRLVRQGEFITDADRDGVLIGEKLATNLAAGLGDELVLLGQAIDGSIAAAKVRVRGVIRTGLPELDRMAVIMNLAPLQSMMAMEGRVSVVAVLLDSHRRVEPLKAALAPRIAALSPDLRVLDWKQVAPGLDQGIQLDSVSGKVMVFLLLLVVAFGILNTFLMSAFERFREFGVMMAIGVKPRACGLLLLLESQLLTAAGFLIGLLIGGALTLYFARAGIPIKGAEEYMAQYGLSSSMYPVLTAGIVGFVLLQVWLVTTAVAGYPAWKITRFRPLEALRHL
ncbi:MAG: ABC transporter permease [Myxococcales bacterium]|nr:ABC transporter permease [Myxococcales bacterium]